MSLLAQRNFAGGEISRALYSRTDTNKYSTGLRLCRNMMIQKHGGVTNRPGTKYLGTIPANKVRLIPFVVNSDNSYVLVFTHLKIDIWQNGSLIQTITSPYDAADINRIQYVQSADVMTLAHKNYAVREIKRSGVPGSYSFSINVMSFVPKTPPPTGMTFAGGPTGGTTTTHTYVFTHINPITSEESLPSVELSGTYTAILDSTSNFITINIPANATYKEAVVYKKQNGRFGYLATVGTGATYRDIGATIFTADSPPENKNILTSANEYPGSVGYFQQRLCFGGTIKEPEKVWMSRSGRFSNFSSSSPVKSDDAISFTAAGRQINEVRHLVDAGSLVMFTSGAEWVAQGSDSSAITPTSINLKQTSYNGSSFIPPLAVNGNVLYMQARGSVIRDLAYEMASDGYRGNDLTVFSSHFFEGYEIVDWCFQQTPNSIVWAVRDDGAVLGLTYIKEHMIFGWHQHNFGGAVENLCTIPNAKEDEVYLVVRREINGVESRYLEKLTTRFSIDGSKLIFMDATKTFNFSAASSNPVVLSGLEHLEGKDVAVFADDFVVASPNNPSYNKIRVVGGKITLSRTYKTIHVGLPYYSDIETLDIDTVQGSIIDRKKLVNKVSIFFENSRGVFVGGKEPVGSDGTKGLRELKTRQNSSISYLTGVEDIRFESSWSQGGRMFIRQVDPIPMTILAISPSGLIPQVGA